MSKIILNPLKIYELYIYVPCIMYIIAVARSYMNYK